MRFVSWDLNTPIILKFIYSSCTLSKSNYFIYVYIFLSYVTALLSIARLFEAIYIFLYTFFVKLESIKKFYGISAFLKYFNLYLIYLFFWIYAILSMEFYKFSSSLGSDWQFELRDYY